jgi:hypothetical protein
VAAAAVAVGSAVVPREPVVQVPAQPEVPAQVPVPVPQVLAQLPVVRAVRAQVRPEPEQVVLAHPVAPAVVSVAVPAELLLSRRSFSAAMARSTP